jgi:hypothetical protein
MKNLDNVADRFRLTLSDHLKKRFGKVVSAQRFADQYNLNAYGTTAISRETARRWIRGKTIPDYGHLVALIHWLEIDPKEFLGGACQVEIGKNIATLPQTDESSELRTANLMTLLEGCDSETLETIMTIAEVLARKPDNKKHIENALNVRASYVSSSI